MEKERLRRYRVGEGMESEGCFLKSLQGDGGKRKGLKSMRTGTERERGRRI